MEQQTVSEVFKMSAIKEENGTTFKIWAPHADKVFAVGNFNNWKENTN